MFRKAALATVLLLALAACSRSPRDYILVIDASGSMQGSGLIDEVKQAMPEFLESVAPGDTVTVVKFDRSAAVGETISIGSAEDRSKVETAVTSIQARGAYTDMTAMLRAVAERAQSAPGRESFVVVMSDGKDDPPPGRNREHVDLASMRDPGADEKMNAAYIYYISLGRLKDPALEENLRRISPHTETVQAGAGVEGSEGATAGERTGLADVAHDIDRFAWLRWLKSNWQWAAIGAGILLALLFVIWLIYKIATGGRVRGAIVYYEAGVGQPVKSVYNLDKLDRNRFSIGAKLGADLRVRNSAIARNVTLKAAAKNGQNFLRPAASDRGQFEFLAQQTEGLISPGDRFRLGNFIFEYGDGSSDR
ncbi:MAG: VWA domain-containing protein [Leptospirales bacterium]|nr:VWA domain-containing protein [Leptospirales bacterium]